MIEGKEVSTPDKVDFNGAIDVLDFSEGAVMIASESMVSGDLLGLCVNRHVGMAIIAEDDGGDWRWIPGNVLLDRRFLSGSGSNYIRYDPEFNSDSHSLLGLVHELAWLCGDPETPGKIAAYWAKEDK